MSSIKFIPKNDQELEMIKEFALRNGLTFTVIPDDSQGDKPTSYHITEEEPPAVEESAGIYMTEKLSNDTDMEKVIIDIKNETDLEYIEQILSERGISFRKGTDIEFQGRLKARKLLSEASQSWPSYDIPMDEIVAQVKEARAERYGRKQDQSNH